LLEASLTEPFILIPGEVTLSDLAHLYWNSPATKLHPDTEQSISAAASIVSEAANGDDAVYGVNTGFGKLASTRIAPEDTARLQRNLILSHCCGVGDPLAEPIVRLIMTLKLLSLGRGASGVRPQIIAQIEALLEAGVTPMIPAQGSVGASGDLAPLAHMTAVMIGEGEAFYKGQRLPAGAALNAAGLSPVELGPKEGLGMINGTQVSTALALAGLFETWRCAMGSMITGALSTDAIMGSSAPFRDGIHTLRGHPGQIDTGRSLRDLMAGSEIRESHRDDDERVQDPYCIRCQPQVLGACIDVLRQAGRTLQIEANAVTDNPLVFVEDGAIISGGNFHAEPVALAADQIALALAEIGSIAQRRVALMVDPAMNFGLPAFLSPDPGVNSGLMIAEVTSAALMSENKQMASPCSVDSTPTSANQEDHVSMATHAARRLLTMADNLGRIVGIELITAAQGVEFRAPLVTSPQLSRVIDRLRENVASMGDDRYMAPDIETSSALIRSGALLDVVGRENLPHLEDQL
jgi:histidine ammonia-lyase